ncbi:MAG: hypothetical protein TE42_06570 [Candidatus Synechococcus spongiarum SP3]|uniref:Single Cache domain-containing protein n=1 Tax=Candidatus Synechococcus spongiarum SP3 TaxID=1604020 RepID=A0A0G2J4M8_9SYNE|nr:MAG: hypothetical protein TE42_06570 [Candidatus Synechococcus spongiarum SP3]
MKALLTAAALSALSLVGGYGLAEDRQKPSAHDAIGQHMVAEALLTAHFIDAAREAGRSPEEINAVLASIAERTALAEFWITDVDGQVVHTNIEGSTFQFPTDPAAGTQAAPFAALLDGSKAVVVQDARPRESDGQVFRYVGVAGVDEPRIVQVGMTGAALQDHERQCRTHRHHHH